MKISIRNPAPLGPNLKKWGDYHFALSLQHALERKGVTVVQRYWPEWDADDEDADAVLVLRGKRQYVPEEGQIALLWVLSHPATVTVAELDRYSRVFFASEAHRELVGRATRVPVEVMRQCTDLDRFGAFNGVGLPTEDRRGIVFVANSRGVRRHMVRWALECQAPLEIYGRHWKDVEPKVRITQEYVENEALPALYAGARLSLNDHWGDMAYFGIVNNRIFDCLACGVPILSDDFPELRRIGGDALLYADSPVAFAQAMQTYTMRYPERIEATRALWERIGHLHTFDIRAEQIIAAVNASAPVLGERGRSSVRGVEAGTGAIECAMRMLSDRGRKGEVKVLHLNPSDNWMRCLLSFDSISYMSGGVGSGAWHFRIDTDQALLPDASIDLLVVDISNRADSHTRDGVSERLAKLVVKVRPRGLIMLTSDDDNLHSILVDKCSSVHLAELEYPLYGKDPI